MQLEGQGQFADALLHPDAPLPAGIVDPQGKPAPKRFAVYQNNVIVSLIEALTATFPAVAALVGEDFFREMARTFVRAHPPVSPLLNEYGREFPDFITAFAPAQRLPFLGDVACLDRAWLDSYHAADADVLDPATIAGIPEEALFGAKFSAHPATQIVRSGFPVVDLWRAGKSGTQAAKIDPDVRQWALVTRPDIEVGVYPLSEADGCFFAALVDGAVLSDAAEMASGETDDLDLARALGLLIRSGAFVSIAV